MQKDLTQGSITKTLLLFAMPMIAGDVLQQFYNIADTLIVGRFGSAGGSRIPYTRDDFFNLHTFGAVNGKRGSFFHSLRREK